MQRVAIGLLFVFGVVASIATSPENEAACRFYGHTEECAERCEDIVDALSQPIVYTPALNGFCLGAQSGPAVCGCFVDEPGDDVATVDEDAGDVGLASLCNVQDRFGRCLDIDLESCVPGEREACTAVCAQVDAFRRADAEPIEGGRVDDTLCDVSCACAIDIGDGCVTATVAVAFDELEDSTAERPLEDEPRSMTRSAAPCPDIVDVF